MPLSRLDLNETLNKSCFKRCNQQKRMEITENDLCKEIKSTFDNLPVRCVGEWAVQKVYLLNQYFGIFANSMKNKWEQINYIEICSGPGRCIGREKGKEFDGTAMSILKHPGFKYVHKALFFDINTTVLDALNKRIDSLQCAKAKALIGDYFKSEEICNSIKKEISPNSLNLVLIDPTDCSVPFNLIRHVKATIPHTDFIINIATLTDFNRNIKDVILNKDKFKATVTKYSRFLGTTSFFQNPENLSFAEQGKNNKLRSGFREAYTNSLKNIGYEFFRYKNINNLYDILFATAHEKGLEFWDKANKYTYDGQGTLNF